MYYIYRKAMKTCALILECNPLYLIFIKATLGSSVSNQGTYINKLCIDTLAIQRIACQYRVRAEDGDW